jgi:hypothetical protein
MKKKKPCLLKFNKDYLSKKKGSRIRQHYTPKRVQNVPPHLQVIFIAREKEVTTLTT